MRLPPVAVLTTAVAACAAPHTGERLAREAPAGPVQLRIEHDALATVRLGRADSLVVHVALRNSGAAEQPVMFEGGQFFILAEGGDPEDRVPVAALPPAHSWGSRRAIEYPNPRALRIGNPILVVLPPGARYPSATEDQRWVIPAPPRGGYVARFCINLLEESFDEIRGQHLRLCGSAFQIIVVE